jgi:ATP-dependent 26S proteasome regulatory subunit
MSGAGSEYDLEVIVRTGDEERSFQGEEWQSDLQEYLEDRGEGLYEQDCQIELEVYGKDITLRGQEDFSMFAREVEEMYEEKERIEDRVDSLTRKVSQLEDKNAELRSKVVDAERDKRKMESTVEKYKSNPLRKATVEEVAEDGNAWLQPDGASHEIKKEIPDHIYEELREGDVLEVSSDGNYGVVGVYRRFDEGESDFRVEPEDLGELAFDDIGGYEGQIERLEEAIVLQDEFPNFFEDEDGDAVLESSGGLLLYGPPGTGKTMSVKALANEYDMDFFLIKGPEVMNKYVGVSERNIRQFARAVKNSAPAVAMFDELDSIAMERGSGTGSNVGERVVSQLLTEMDGMDEYDDVYWVATSNRLDLIDDALKRPGRFGTHIEFDTPDEEESRDIASKYMPDEIADVVVDTVFSNQEYQEVNSGSLLRDVRERAVKDYLQQVKDGEVAREDWLEDPDVDVADLSRIPLERFEEAVDEVYGKRVAEGHSLPPADDRMFE